MPSLLDDASSSTEKSHTKQAANIFSGFNQPSSSVPKGVVLDKDGKPCRTCTSSAAWMAMMKSSTSDKSQSQSQTQSKLTLSDFSAMMKSSSQPVQSPKTTYTTEIDEPQQPADCPPDVEALGRSSWTLLHSLTASYPSRPDPTHQKKTHTFLSLFSQLYPCWVCAEDFQTWMKEDGSDMEEALKSQEGFGRWMCRAHNAVNVKLGKEEFDCNFWKERWRDGWKDGRCD